MAKDVKIVREKITNNGGGAVYGLGIIGALFYFLQSATTFSAVILGIFKSLFWPAFLIYSLLGHLNL